VCFAESQWGVPQASGTNPPWVTSPPPPTPQSIPRPASRRTATAGSGGGSFLAGFLFASLSPPIYYTKARPLFLSFFLALTLFIHLSLSLDISAVSQYLSLAPL